MPKKPSSAAKPKRLIPRKVPSPLVAQWKEARAALHTMNVVERLGFLLTQSDETINANKRSFYPALVDAAHDYYGKFLVEAHIASDANLAVTRRIVDLSLAQRSKTEIEHRPYVVLYEYISPHKTGHDSPTRDNFIKSHLACIEDAANKGDLDHALSGLRLIGHIHLAKANVWGQALACAPQREAMAQSIIKVTSAVVDAFITAGRLDDAVEVMHILKTDIRDTRVMEEASDRNAIQITSQSYERLAAAIVQISQDKPLLEVTHFLDVMKSYSDDRKKAENYTEPHDGLMQQLAGIESAKRKEMMDGLAARLGQKPAAEHKK